MTDTPVAERIRKEISANDVTLFMKGTPAAPQCGFSAHVAQGLQVLGVPFKGIDVLADPELREGIKAFSQWPTLPQLFIKGEFVGGADIFREMVDSGELVSLMKEKGVPLRRG